MAVFRQVLNDVRNSLENVFEPDIVEPALFGVSLRQSQRASQPIAGTMSRHQ
jgi:hypothetical protein